MVMNMSAKIQNIVNLLKSAADAYYNGKDLLIDDETYDALRDELETLDPQNPFLKQIGAPVAQEGAVKLPYKMASLNKIKPGSGAVDSFKTSSKVKSWVLSDKLDGISVLWDTGKRKLYLRGDGFTGVDVSKFAPYINQLTPRCFNKKWVLRGELVIPNSVDVNGTLARSWVNGQLHQKTPIPEQLGKINFVAYELIQPANLTREEQFRMMSEEGFLTPWHTVTTVLSDESLGTVLVERRKASDYAIDGIVVGENNVPVKDTSDTVSNPKDMRAFKMPLGDQQAETEVVDILWSASYQGYIIPRLQIKPVMISGSRIEYLTGHNAKFVVDNQVGKGAKIIIRKSGDVIPTLDRVIEPCSDIELPKGVWDGPHLKLTEEDHGENDDVIVKKLEHFAKTLDIPHLGPGQCVKLISAGIVSPGDLVNVNYPALVKAIGEGMAKKVFPAIQTQVEKASEMDLMVASSVMPRGIGASKLKTLFALEADPRLWPSRISSCEGWSDSALQSFYTRLPSYAQWRKEELPSIPYPKMVRPIVAPVVQQATKKEYFCFTGFRSAELQAKLESKGHEFTPTFSKKTTILVVTDESALNANTEKIKKARDSGARILTRDQLMREYL
jgi:NAD-dependent DNA ligase